jgi:hypothetical protein
VPVNNGWKICQEKKKIYKITKILRNRTPASYCGGPGLNLSAEANYPEWGSSWLSPVHPGVCFDRPLLRFPKSSFTIIFPCDTRYSIWLRRQEFLHSSLKSKLRNN